jgi:hypothetical protein
VAAASPRGATASNRRNEFAGTRRHNRCRPDQARLKKWNLMRCAIFDASTAHSAWVPSTGSSPPAKATERSRDARLALIPYRRHRRYLTFKMTHVILNVDDSCHPDAPYLNHLARRGAHALGGEPLWLRVHRVVLRGHEVSAGAVPCRPHRAIRPATVLVSARAVKQRPAVARCGCGATGGARAAMRGNWADVGASEGTC